MSGEAMTTADRLAAPAHARVPLRAGTVPYALLLAFVLVLYGHPGLLLPQLETLRPAALIGLAAAATAVATRTLLKQPIVVPWPQGYGMAGLVAVAAISSFHALWPRHAVENTMDLVRVAAMFFVIVNVVDSRRRLWGLVVALVAAGTLPALGALTGFGVRAPAAEGRFGWVGNYANPNDLAFNLVALVPLALAVAVAGGRRERLLAWPALALYLAAIFFTYSRGGLLGLVVVLALAALRERGTWPRLLAALGIGAAVVFVTSFWARDQGFGDLADDPTVMQRLVTIDVGLTMWADRPLIGVGPGCSVLGWPLYAPDTAELSGGWLHNHNTYVQALSETGVLGFLALAVVIGGSLRQTRQARRAAIHEGDRKLLRLAGALNLSLWAFLACSLAAGLLLSWIPYLVAGAACAMRRIEERAAFDLEAEEWPR